MSGVGLIGIAAEGNENVFLNHSKNTLFQIRNEDFTIEHFAIYNTGRDVSGPVTAAFDSNTEYIINLPMENDGIGAGFVSLQLPEINSSRQESMSWNKNLMSSMIKKVQLRGNKNVINERTGKQMLYEAKTKYNTTKYALFQRLVGMTPNQSSPYYQTYTDRHERHRNVPLIHQTIRTHTPFGHMIDRPIDIAAGQLSAPIVRDDLFLQHVKVSYPDSFFDRLEITRENITLANLRTNTFYELENINQNLTDTTLLNTYKDEWNVIHALSTVGLEETDLVSNATATSTLEIADYTKTVFKYRKQKEIERWWKIWQEYEFNWSTTLYLSPRTQDVPFYATISSVNTSTNPFKIYVSGLTSNESNAFTNDTYYYMRIIRDTDLYGYPNNTSELVGELKDSNTTTPYFSVPEHYLPNVNTTTDIGNSIIKLPGQHGGFANVITTSGSDPDSALYYLMTVNATNGTPMTPADFEPAGFTANNTNQLILGNVTIDTNYPQSTYPRIWLPQSFPDGANVSYEGLPIIIHNPYERAGIQEPQIKPLFELFHKSLPQSWGYDAQRYRVYTELSSQSNLITYLPELFATSTLDIINRVMQVHIQDDTANGTSPIDFELNKLNNWYTDINTNLTTERSTYLQSLVSARDIFKGLNESYDRERYGGYQQDYLRVHNYIQSMNNLIIRLGRMQEVQDNTTIFKLTQELFPKLTQQYGNISYHYHADILRDYTEPVYEIMELFAENCVSGPYFPGTASITNSTLASAQSQFPEPDYMPYVTFVDTDYRDKLMRQIDYVDGTREFCRDIEATYTSLPNSDIYSPDYFTLLDVSGSITKDDIESNERYRFIFWYRVFDVLDKCRLIKELWANRYYNTNSTYKENLEALENSNRRFWVFCIEFYDLFTKQYAGIYDEYRLGVPSLTQQNLPYSQVLKLSDSDTYQAIDNVRVAYNLDGTIIPNTSPFYFHYQNLQFPAPSNTGVSHLYRIPQASSPILINPSTPYDAIINILKSINTNSTTSSISSVVSNLTNTSTITTTTTSLYNSLVNTTISLLNDSYIADTESETEPIEMFNVLKSFIYDIGDSQYTTSNLTELYANSSSLFMYPTQQNGGFFHSTLGSTMGFIVAKDYATGIPYQGFQTENEEWSNVTNYSDRVANITSDLGPYKTTSLSSTDIMSIAFNSNGVNITSFFDTINVSPIVFGFKENIDHVMPLQYDPITYRSYNYRVSKYIPQSKWDGCDTSLVSMLPNPLIQYFEYLRINLIHPEDVPSAYMATNYSEILSQQDDPWIMSHSKNKLTSIKDIVDRTTKEPSISEEANILEEVGYRENEGAVVIDPITQQKVPAFKMPLMISRVNASRNPLRNEQMMDMNLRVLYRTYLSSQNQIDSVNAIEVPKYVPRHIQDLSVRACVRATQNIIADFVIDTTPQNYTVDRVVYDETKITNSEYMIMDIRYILTDFLRMLSRSNVPIENHRSVKVGFNSIWIPWKSNMIKWLRMGIVNYVVNEFLTLVKLVYTSMNRQLYLFQQSEERKTEIWLEIIYAMMSIEEFWDIQINPDKDDDDFLDLLYTRLSDYIKDKVKTNPFIQYSSRIITWKNIVINMVATI